MLSAKPAFEFYWINHSFIQVRNFEIDITLDNPIVYQEKKNLNLKTSQMCFLHSNLSKFQLRFCFLSVDRMAPVCISVQATPCEELPSAARVTLASALTPLFVTMRCR